MEPIPREIVEYLGANDEYPYRVWLRGLRDGKGRGIIRNRINRLTKGELR